MYSKEERKKLNLLFWTQFDSYCEKLPMLSGRKKKWILHDTKISHIDLKFDIGRNFAVVALEINHRSETRRLRVYELLERYRLLLEEGFQNGLIWDFAYLNSSHVEVCRIYTEIHNVDFHRECDWPVIYAFFSEKMGQLQENFMEIQEALKEEVNQLHREL